MGALKTEASVDYSLRIERLLSRSGWVEGFGELLGARALQITVREAILLHFYVVFYGSGFTDNS